MRQQSDGGRIHEARPNSGSVPVETGNGTLRSWLGRQWLEVHGSGTLTSFSSDSVCPNVTPGCTAAAIILTADEDFFEFYFKFKTIR
jgi:hypothetical protein